MTYTPNEQTNGQTDGCMDGQRDEWTNSRQCWLSTYHMHPQATGAAVVTVAGCLLNGNNTVVFISSSSCLTAAIPLAVSLCTYAGVGLKDHQTYLQMFALHTYIHKYLHRFCCAQYQCVNAWLYWVTFTHFADSNASIHSPKISFACLLRRENIFIITLDTLEGHFWVLEVQIFTAIATTMTYICADNFLQSLWSIFSS